MTNTMKHGARALALAAALMMATSLGAATPQRIPAGPGPFVPIDSTGCLKELISCLEAASTLDIPLQRMIESATCVVRLIACLNEAADSSGSALSRPPRATWRAVSP